MSAGFPRNADASAATLATLPPALRQSLFITGTDTAVGKTWAAVRLLQAWARSGHRAAGMKPVAAGATLTPEGPRNDDALALLAAANVPIPYALCNPLCLPRPTSPHLAAREAGIDINLDLIARPFHTIASQSDLIAVEGAGGWLTPLTPTLTMADLAIRLNLPILLVIGIRLGCLNHALLTAQAITGTGLKLAAWLPTPIDPHFPDHDAYVETLTQRLPAPRVHLPHF
ncbi:MAG: dethiobiotin synthase [Nevskiaceae bacterium]|jgi:dethiobiotin synthetase|nr:dethiobiotin synthase [Nevskiaceae bacterium]